MIYEKTASTMAKKNNLTLSKKDKHSYVYDFSELDKIDFLQAEDYFLQSIKDQVVKFSSVTEKYIYISEQKDQFECICGHVYVKPIMVYNAIGKHRYTVMRLAHVEISQFDRKSIYDEYEITNTHKENYCFEYQTEYVEVK